MTIAWFRATPLEYAGSFDETAAAIGVLRSAHAIRIVTAAEADEFVWRNHHDPVSLCVFELSGEPGSAFIWPYLFRYPGLAIVSGGSVHNARAAMLQQQGRHEEYRAEFFFNEGHLPPERHKVLPRGSWPMLRAALAASKLTVVRHTAIAEALGHQYPDVRIRQIPLGFGRADSDGLPEHGEHPPIVTDGSQRSLRCAVYGEGRAAVAERAAARATTTRPVEIVTAPDEPQLNEVDLVLAMTWPPGGESLMPALAGIAARRPVVVFETEITAGWPTIDPQTWQPRGPGHAGRPVGISLDPRDEEHSLMLALKRLEADRGFADTLAAAGHAWWKEHGTLDQTIDVWHHVLAEAVSAPVPPKPAGWPPHLEADGTQRLREVLSAFDVDVDFAR